MNKQSYILLIFSVFLMMGVDSCTIKKRSYQPGYYVEWHNVNKKSRVNTENSSVKQQENGNDKELVVENIKSKPEEFNNPKVITENNPVFSSIDESNIEIEIVRTSEKDKPFFYEDKEGKSKTLITENNDIEPESFENRDAKLPVPDLAIAGIVLSVLGVAFIAGGYLSESVVVAVLFLFLPGLIFTIIGAAFSFAIMIIILRNRETYSGLWIAITGLTIPTILMIVLYWGFWPLIALMTILLALIIFLVAFKYIKHAG